jgi:hypothetical protein
VTDQKGPVDVIAGGADNVRQDQALVVVPGRNADTDVWETPKASAKAAKAGKINWLGSSYSGADIKVVAHLYVPVGAGLDKTIDELRSQIAVVDFILELSYFRLDLFSLLTNARYVKEKA